MVRGYLTFNFGVSFVITMIVMGIYNYRKSKSKRTEIQINPIVTVKELESKVGFRSLSGSNFFGSSYKY